MRYVLFINFIIILSNQYFKSLRTIDKTQSFSLKAIQNKIKDSSSCSLSTKESSDIIYKLSEICPSFIKIVDVGNITALRLSKEFNQSNLFSQLDSYIEKIK